MQAINESSQGGTRIDPALALMELLRASQKECIPVNTHLIVDDRVLARVTDGIYRRPSAALRELVFNAYDADATRVVIDTDAPRFQRMSIRDNGIGMDERVLADLITHIGGSSKKTHKGIEIGTVNRDNPNLSPAGRPLIGKIGIGLFAVVHLTTNFRIITKRRGVAYRLVADVRMKTHTEDNLVNLPRGDAGKEEFVTGDVSIVHEPATDTETHGTEVVLLELRSTTRDILRDAQRWEAILEEQAGQAEKSSPPDGEPHYKLSAPQFHVGFLGDRNSRDAAFYLVEPSLPWDDKQNPTERFQSLYESVVETAGTTQRNPDLEYIFDQYFESLWRLSLAAPISYLKQHPLQLTTDSGIDFFHLQNKPRSRAEPISLNPNERLNDNLGLKCVDRDPVMVDGVELRRPVRLYGDLMEAKHAKNVRAKRPMLFVGQCNTSLGSYAPEQSGGALEFEAYFYWNALIVPNQNRGVLVRVHGASGVLYDERFMDYQTAELNRLKQITGEVFILKGMDPALNIDRESFNVSHPHYQYVAKWVHNSIRQITNLLKEIGKKSINHEQASLRMKANSALAERINAIWQHTGDDLQSPPEISIFTKDGSQAELQFRSEGGMAFHLPPTDLQRAESGGQNTIPSATDQAKAIMTVLVAYGLLESVPYARQQQVFEDIIGILLTGRDA